MKITHIAIWTNDLERSRSFYENYFNGKSNEKYVNATKGFASYFVSFEGSVTLEIMQRNDIFEIGTEHEKIGFAHLAFSVESREKVNDMIETFRKDGYKILGEPRLSGDGFFEGVIADPDNNKIEIIY